MADVKAEATGYYQWCDNSTWLMVDGVWRSVKDISLETRREVMLAFCHPDKMRVNGSFDDSNEENQIHTVQIVYRK